MTGSGQTAKYLGKPVAYEGRACAASSVGSCKLITVLDRIVEWMPRFLQMLVDCSYILDTVFAEELNKLHVIHLVFAQDRVLRPIVLLKQFVFVLLLSHPPTSESPVNDCFPGPGIN